MATPIINATPAVSPLVTRPEIQPLWKIKQLLFQANCVFVGIQPTYGIFPSDLVMFQSKAGATTLTLPLTSFLYPQTAAILIHFKVATAAQKGAR